MRDELQQDLFAIEPKWFDLKRTMQFGFEIGDGWYGIVRELLDFAAAQRRPGGPFEPGLFEILQIKQKFGALRIYFSGGTADFMALVDRAEKASATTCEVCGAKGESVMRNAWTLTLCKTHADEPRRIFRY